MTTPTIPGAAITEAQLAAARERLLDYLTLWTGDRDRAEDLTQEALVRFLDENPTDLRSLDAWLCRVATNLAKDAHRTTQRHARLHGQFPDMVTPDAPPATDRRTEQSEVQRIVRAGLSKLPPHYRTALLMREQGFKHREIAEVLDVGTNAVGMIIARAVRQLATVLPSKESFT